MEGSPAATSSETFDDVHDDALDVGEWRRIAWRLNVKRHFAKRCYYFVGAVAVFVTSDSVRLVWPGLDFKNVVLSFIISSFY